jgi:hypothetical protein
MGAVMRSAAPQRIVAELLAAELAEKWDLECDAVLADSSTVLP